MKALKPIDYKNEGNVVLAVDTSYITVGYYIYQEHAENPKKKDLCEIWVNSLKQKGG